MQDALAEGCIDGGADVFLDFLGRPIEVLPIAHETANPSKRSIIGER